MPAVITLVDDLMFLSRIREAAKAAGVEVKAARAVAGLPELTEGARLVLIDLDSPRLPVSEAVAALKDRTSGGLQVVGFFSHVHGERARQALAAGCTRVLPRSAFVKELPALLASA